MKSILQRPEAKTLFLAFAVVLISLTGGADDPRNALHLLPQAIGLLLLLLGVFGRWDRPLPDAGRALILLGGLGALLILLQSIPLPSGVRAFLPGGEMLRTGFDLVGHPMPAMPVTLNRADTFSAIFDLLVPVGILAFALRLPLERTADTILVVVPALAVFAALVGIGQITLPMGERLYPYEVTNVGLPVGYFANVNHATMAMLSGILIGVAFVHRAEKKARGADARIGLLVAAGAALLILVSGVLLAGSVAGYALLPVTLICAFLLLYPRWFLRQNRWKFVLPSVLIAGFALAFFVAQPLLDQLGYGANLSGATSRAAIWSGTLSLILEFWSTGAGVGAFDDIYRLTETDETIGRQFVNHAHNDYLEWVLETGILGALLMVAVLVVVLRECVSVWRSEGRRSHRRTVRAASFVVGILLLHSFVDYPLRTPALAAVAALCVAACIGWRTVKPQASAKPASDTRSGNSVVI